MAEDCALKGFRQWCLGQWCSAVHLFVCRLERERRNAEQETKARDVRLQRALEEVERYKAMLGELRSQVCAPCPTYTHTRTHTRTPSLLYLALAPPRHCSRRCWQIGICVLR